MSAIDRAAVARTSTNVSSISTMIIRIIRAGSSDRSSNSVTFAAMISRVRVKIGTRQQAGERREADGCAVSAGAWGSAIRGVRVGTLASIGSSLCTDGDRRACEPRSPGRRRRRRRPCS